MRAKLLPYVSLLSISMACTTSGGEPLLIIQNQVATDGCLIPDGITDAYLPRGKLDVNALSGYVFNPLVQNIAEGDTSIPGHRLALITGADVKVDFQFGFITDEEKAGWDADTLARFEAYTEFRRNFSGTIQPNGGYTAFSFVTIQTPLIDEFIAPKLSGDQTVEVGFEVRLRGNMDGSGVSSSPFSYYVDVCDGCMTQNLGSCALLPSDFQASEGSPCNTLQDFVLECCTDAENNELCPAQAPSGQ